ncbi:MAG: serine hydrolase [Planctomycetota bacterium]|nr:serine hydrolase [Planctomycetota bacterium]
MSDFTQPLRGGWVRAWLVLSAAALLAAGGCASQHSAPRDSRAQFSRTLAETRAYVPPKGSWQRRAPEDFGIDATKLAEAVAWARQQESTWDFAKQEEIFGRKLGPLPASRASNNGVILKDGYIIAEWGDIEAADPTYSVAKSYLSTILGLTLDAGLIGSIDEKVGERVQDGGFASAHNAQVTWRHFATMTSEWEGSMFGKDSTLQGAHEHGKSAIEPRAVRAPGTFFEYNDVRINRFSLSMLRLWKQPLPEVWRERVMDPIGASATWRWIPYDHATVNIDGTPMPSISGGTRWGGGLWISTLDHARFALLVSRSGAWGDRQLVSRAYLAEAVRPQGVKKDYGLLWWLNTENRWPAAGRETFSAQGAGDHSLWIDRARGLLVVWRWHTGGDTQAELYKRIIEAMPAPAAAEN